LPTRTRYKVLAVAVLLAGITYLDRVCISMTAPGMMRDLHLDRIQMGFVFSAFTLAYGLFEIPTGWWGDRVGTRRVLTRIVTWWSVFTMLTGAALGYGSLLAIRFLFGVGEAGAWPNVARTFSRWFPVEERGTAQGIFFMGAHLAGGLTPLLITALLVHFDWRWLFVLIGSVGFIWAIGWFRWFRDEPEQHPAVNREELTHIKLGRAAAQSHQFSRAQWRQLLSSRSVYGLCGMYLTQTYGFYFYITWLPSYLRAARGFSSYTLAILAGLPLTVSVVADLIGGLTTDRLTRRAGIWIGRVAVGGGSLALAGVFMIAGTAAPNGIAAAILISIAGAFSNFLLGSAWATCSDIAGNHAGVLSATMNTAGQVGGFLSPIIAAFLLQKFGNWSLPLYVTGALYLAGAVCWLLVDPRRPVFDV
jgi:MFS family permease